MRGRGKLRWQGWRRSCHHNRADDDHRGVLKRDANGAPHIFVAECSGIILETGGADDIARIVRDAQAQYDRLHEWIEYKADKKNQRGQDVQIGADIPEGDPFLPCRLLRNVRCHVNSFLTMENAHKREQSRLCSLSRLNLLPFAETLRFKGGEPSGGKSADTVNSLVICLNYAPTVAL